MANTSTPEQRAEDINAVIAILVDAMKHFNRVYRERGPYAAGSSTLILSLNAHQAIALRDELQDAKLARAKLELKSANDVSDLA